MNLFISTCLLILLIDNNVTNGRAIGSIDEPRKRIVNGQDAQLFDIPSQVALMRKFDGVWDRWCGAVLIAWNKVLTAAHCVDDSLPSDIRAVVGFLNYNEPLTGYEQIASISEINVHENDRTILNLNVYDIAVLTLATPVVPSIHVKVARLADKSESYVNTTCIISGWGYTNKTLMARPNGLQKAVTMIISNTECKMEWPQFADALDEELFLCVHNEKGKSDQPTSICAGDSGGPLLCGPNNDILVGTAVSNEGKCKGLFPQFFTNVAAYKDWLADRL
ncbi:fibrinolytic enzyme, isozyme C-like [Biomphalaria glabrata]|uniref:Fibrinolytic enzyme, isozyme C-like n=1 Tax=Biomphalaria glabrata TaxID=6526 RepID=A0A9W2ZI85_BIOGL|nr:fibrinolytic enzyme, isozyme C-like [Biomphalaria glabrata]